MSVSSRATIKYGLSWDSRDFPTDLHIEFYMMGQSDEWLKGQGTTLLQHYLAARKLVWPHRYEHRWTRLIYEEILKNRITILMGSASSQKSSHAAEFVLLDYWSHPDNTAVLISSTTRDKLEQAVWGEVKMLFKSGKDSHKWLPGVPLEHKQAILTDSVAEFSVRDFRKGLVCKPCYTGKQYVGLGVYAGIKQERLRFLADELQFMAPTFLDCLDNMSSNTREGGLKVIGSGNPKHDPDDQLGIAAEPMDGWESVADRDKTSVWDTRMYRARCVNLVGTDSPNFDVGPNEKEPYTGLIGPTFAKIIEHDHGRNSPQFETQVMGRMKLALAHARVITRELCRQHKAHDKVYWKGTNITKIKALDPAYGGGDRCIEMSAEFGLDMSGKTVIRITGYKIIRIDLKKKDENGNAITPEDQIAKTIWEDAKNDGVPAENIFYDSFGKGTIGFAFARQFGSRSPVPVDSGAQPSKRAVRQDLFVLDETRRQKRLKRCDEHYSKFVTEMWFSVRYAIEADQIRELPIDVMLEGCMREYETVAGNKLEVEPKDKMRERSGKSPDLFDCCAILVEGARRLGFTIDKLGSGLTDEEDGFNWMDDWRKSHESLIRSKQLAYK